MDFTEVGLFIARNVQFYQRSPVDYGKINGNRRRYRKFIGGGFIGAGKGRRCSLC
ncbi:hypothetical protein YC2023_111405 [Brassica napus]